jgi:hypothetical protein
MRLWSIHPQYLDRIGLIALWRETLLAKKVLLGETKGYKNHPQLKRFKTSDHPVLTINTYLFYIYEEAKNRNYNFNFSKVGEVDLTIKIIITDKQLQYEFKHLLNKLEIRDQEKFKEIKNLRIEAHPIFIIVKGKIEDWERV